MSFSLVTSTERQNDQLELEIRGLITDYGRRPTFAEVRAAYSADSLCGNKIRKPFHYRGAPHIAGGGCHMGERYEVEIYELIPRASFTGATTTYQERVSRDGGNRARHDPRGFYYGIAVSYGGVAYVVGESTATLIFDSEKLTAEKPPRDRTKKAA